MTINTRKRQQGFITFVVLVLLFMIVAFAAFTTSTASRLHREVKLVEQRQLHHWAAPPADKSK